MMDIEWDKAPEGTTHAFRPTRLGQTTHWRMVGEFDVYYWGENQWEPLDGDDPRDPAEWIEEFVENGDAVPRPAPLEAELPDGEVWPEGMTHYSPKIGGLFFNEKTYIYQNFHPTPWMHEGQFKAWADFDDTIARFPGAQPNAAPKEEPPKKRAVGWWS